MSDVEGAPLLRICLAASGGGHVRQLLDLEPVWSAHESFFITEETALGTSLAKSHEVRFLPHFAFGQLKRENPLAVLAAAFQSLRTSFDVMRRERPDVVITTGAGAVIFPTILGRLFGAEVVVVESFARFTKPSLFSRLAAPFASELIVQSPLLSTVYPHARVFDPMRSIDEPAPAKQPLLFATVGATLPFPRLADAIRTLKAEGAIPEHVILQTGGEAQGAGDLECVGSLDFSVVQQILRDASIVVCHGGTGSIITALREGCHVIAMPRLLELGEHYDDHQSEITDAFVERGLIRVARTVDDLRAVLSEVRDQPRRRATTDPQALIAHLRARLQKLRPRPRVRV